MEERTGSVVCSRVVVDANGYATIVYVVAAAGGCAPRSVRLPSVVFSMHHHVQRLVGVVVAVVVVLLFWDPNETNGACFSMVSQSFTAFSRSLLASLLSMTLLS